MNEDQPSKLALSAEWYANLGWKIMPCHGVIGGRCTCKGNHPEPKDVGKHPAINSWNSAATDNLETIRRWWREEPNYNIGVFCRPSGFLVIDIDPRSKGDESFQRFEEILEGNLPPTIEATTGTYTVNGKQIKGRHLFYKCDPSEDLIGQLNKLDLKGIDIKHNGYVLIAPSNHYSGTTYEWVQGKRPDQIEMADAPEELLNLLRKKNRRKGSTSLGSAEWDTAFGGIEYDGERLDVDKLLSDGLVEGERAIGLYKIALALANRFPVDTEYGALAVETLMIRFNAEKVKPPMELEGPNSVLMHTRRAIEFVRNNPKTKMSWPDGTSFDKLKPFVENSTKESLDSLNRNDQPKEQLKPLLGVIPPKIETEEDYYDTGLSDSGLIVTNSIQSGHSMKQTLSNRNLEIAPDRDSLMEEDGGTPGRRSLTDIGNGRRIVDTFSPVIRYTEGLGWFFWNEVHWKPDVEQLDVKELAKKLGPIIASETKHYNDDDAMKVVKWAHDSKAVSKINSAIDSAKSDSRIRLKVDDWDKSPDLLGVKNGVVDLRTGALMKNSPDLYITRSSPIGYIQGQVNGRWQQFLDFATGGDKEFQDWLQRAAGYSITGHKSHDVLFMVYGPAGSGKNTFVEALVKCLGTKQYAWPFDTSVLSQGDGKSTQQDQYHWAELRGRRVVWVDELPDSERIKENSIKKLTGSSEIGGRSPGEKPFTFTSQAKLWISTNHRPIITDDAMWRRIRPIPFIHVPEKPDPDLKEYIFDPNGALPAVLSWAVEGAIKVLNSSATDSLGWCKVVRDAASIYQKTEDRIGIFLEEETRVNPDATVGMRDLFALYRIWSEQRGEKPLTQIAFDRKLRDRNMQLEGSGSRVIIKGIMMPPRIIQNESIPGIGAAAARLSFNF